MVAARLDQSRVLVTKFRQNQLTLKGSASQRHTDRQTRLKIRAVQVCNWAKNFLIGNFDCVETILIKFGLLWVEELL